jgi:acetolactate synthase regulatory subunit
MDIPWILHAAGRSSGFRWKSREFRKPILRDPGYSGGMNTTHKSYRFRIDADAPLATLEAALAVVRRLGIELRGLRTTSTAQGLEVLLRLAAPEPDPLTLCRMRLHNVIGVQAIREMPATAAAG